MSGESEHRTYKWVLPLVVGVFCGGLGGSVFTWYNNRPKSTVVTYTITSTTIAAAKSASGLVPGLKVMIDSEQVASLYTFNIEFRPRQGPYLDRVEVALEFPSSDPFHIYGSKIESPSTANHIDCNQTKTGFLCILMPLDTTHAGTYRMTIATDQSQAPRLTSAAKGVDFVPAEQFGTGVDKTTWLQMLTWLFVGMSLVFTLRELVDTLLSTRRLAKMFGRPADED